MGRLRIELRDASWAALAGAIQSLGPFGSFLILARLAPPEELGRYSLAVAITIPVFLVARMQLRQAAVADPQGGSAFGSYRALRALAATAALAAIWLAAALLGSGILAAVALSRWAEELGDIHYAPLQRAGLWPRITASQLLRLAGVLAIMIVGWSRLGLAPTLICVAAWQAAVTLAVDLPCAARLESGGSTRTVVARLCRLNWPLGAAAAVVSLMSYVPRYALAWTGDEALVGDYAALGQIALLGTLVVQGAGQASLGRLGVSFIADRARFSRTVRELLLVSSAVGVCGVLAAALWGEVLLAAVFQPRFGALSAELVGMMAAAGCVYTTSVFGYGLTAAGVKGRQLTIFGAALIVGAITSFPLSATYGLAGAIAGNICSWATAALLSGMLLKGVVGATQRDDPSTATVAVRRPDGSRAV